VSSAQTSTITSIAWRVRRRDDGTGEAGQLDQLAEHRAKQEYREVKLDETDHLLHEHPGEGRRDRAGIGEQDGAEGGEGGEQDDAVAPVGGQHQQAQGGKGDDHAHRAYLHGAAGRASHGEGAPGLFLVVERCGHRRDGLERGRAVGKARCDNRARPQNRGFRGLRRDEGERGE
jgi:hypothetical protein